MNRFHIAIGDRTVVVDRRVTVGRSPDCDVQIDDSAASRRHCAFVLASGKMWVEDLGSRNGILVRGVPVKRMHALEHGDTVTVGSTVIVVSDPQAATLPPARPASGGAPRPAGEDFDAEAPTGGHASMSHQLLAAAEASLDRGDVRDAARSLHFLIATLIEDLQLRRRPPADVVREVSRLAVRMSSVTRDPVWLERLEDLRRAGGR